MISFSCSPEPLQLLVNAGIGIGKKAVEPDQKADVSGQLPAALFCDRAMLGKILGFPDGLQVAGSSDHGNASARNWQARQLRGYRGLGERAGNCVRGGCCDARLCVGAVKQIVGLVRQKRCVNMPLLEQVGEQRGGCPSPVGAAADGIV